MSHNDKYNKTKNLKLSNVKSVENISDEWVDLWQQVELWYGDIQKKETGQQLLERLQSNFDLKRFGK